MNENTTTMKIGKINVTVNVVTEPTNRAIKNFNDWINEEAKGAVN